MSLQIHSVTTDPCGQSNVPINTRSTGQTNQTSKPAVTGNPATTFTLKDLCKPMQNVLSNTQTAQKVRQVKEKGVWDANITDNTSFFGKFAQRLENVCLKLFYGNIDEKLNNSLTEVKNWLCSIWNDTQGNYRPDNAESDLKHLQFLQNQISSLPQDGIEDVTTTLRGLIELTQVAAQRNRKHLFSKLLSLKKKDEKLEAIIGEYPKNKVVNGLYNNLRSNFEDQWNQCLKATPYGKLGEQDLTERQFDQKLPDADMRVNKAILSYCEKYCKDDEQKQRIEQMLKKSLKIIVSV